MHAVVLLSSFPACDISYFLGGLFIGLEMIFICSPALLQVSMATYSYATKVRPSSIAEFPACYHFIIHPLPGSGTVVGMLHC